MNNIICDTDRFKNDDIKSKRRIRPTDIYELGGLYKFDTNADSVTLYDIVLAKSAFRTHLVVITFSRINFEIFLDFTRNNEKEIGFMCDRTKACDGMLNIFVEDESYHL